MTTQVTPSQRSVAATFMKRSDFSRNPMLVYWEMTQACGLACKHCRAEAMPRAHPLELKTAESRAFIRQLVQFRPNPPHLILTGGDPLSRPDLFELIDYARSLGLGVSITPSATTELSEAAILNLQKHGIQALGLSLDGSTASRHDAIRGIEGTFERTLHAARYAGRIGLPIQINTLVSEETSMDLPSIYELLHHFPVMRWSLFFLISVGRGKALNEVTPERAEQLMRWVIDVLPQAPFAIKTTEAPFFRRIALSVVQTAPKSESAGYADSIRSGFQIRDGHGVMFVSNTGDIYPSGFLPLSCGNVRKDSVVDAYHNSDLFRALHRPSTFQGRCGRCEYSHLCGGSRARAFAHSGDPLGEDPLCLYQPGERVRVGATL